MTSTENELELADLMRSQLKDMAQGSRQWPEHEVVVSLDIKLRGYDGDGSVLGDYIDQDGRLAH